MSDPTQICLGLSRAKRLQRPGEFSRVRQNGQRVAKGCLIANWLILPTGSISRVGVVTTRRLGKAHLRSRARRLLRESFRLHQRDLRVPVDLVLVARNSILGRKRPEVEKDLMAVLRQAQLLKPSA